MTAQTRWIVVRNVAAILIGLFGVFTIFNWFMLPKDIYFRRLNLWLFFVLPASAGLIAWLLHPRSTPATKQLAKTLTVIYSVAFSLFLLSFGIAFARNNTPRYW